MLARRVLFVLLLIPGVLGLTSIQAQALPFVVNSVADPGNSDCGDGTCTLREAIAAANLSVGLDDITFDIPGTGQHTIAVTGSALPDITSPVTIDGFSDPDDVGRIELDGAEAGAGAAGLWVRLTGSGTTITGMVINGFADEGIQLDSGGNVIQGNFLGTDATGLVADANFRGISVGGSGNQIGGAGAGQGNVISGNTNDGVNITGTLTVLEGNRIGPGSDGSTDLGNGNQGILINGSSNNTIGGTSAAARNVISGNAVIGVLISGGVSTGNIVRGNYIGTKASGTEALPNVAGVSLQSGANGNTIGGTAAGAGNVISGNGSHGVQVFGSASTGNTIQGNMIGTASSGTAALANGGDGINVFDAPNTLIGGGSAGARNVISGNLGDGIEIGGTGADSNQVRGNTIGLGSDGSTDIGNGVNGIYLTQGGSVDFLSGTQIGGTGAGEGNVISGNTGDGIRADLGRVQNSTLQGNIVGLAADGSTDRGNDGDGLDFVGSGTTTVGGTTAAARNIISGNGGRGAALLGFVGNYVVQGNFIGMDASGATAVANGQGGIQPQGNATTIGGTAGVTVGGSCTGACNLISGNTGTGIFMSSNQTIQGNYVGTDVTGLLDRGNTQFGMSSGTDNTVITIGGTTPEARNIISGNNNHGISMADTGAHNKVIQGNYIGVGSNGTTPLGNGGEGIFLGGDDNTIGGTSPGAGNVIAHNTGRGVFLNANATGNQIRGNSIHSNGGLGIDLDPAAMVNANDLDDPDIGANNRQNYPLLATAQVNAGAVTVNGSLNSVPSSAFALDFYSSPSCNAAAPSNHGEGQTYLGELAVNTDAGGDTPFTFISDGTPAVSAGEVITATATDASGNTSEFSRCRVALGTASPTLSIADAMVTEGNSGSITANFTVTLSAMSPDTVTVNWATADGTAAAPADYQAVTSGVLTFAPNDTSETAQVQVNGDVIDEGASENFTVTLSDAGGATIADGQATGTITDNDDPPTISVLDATVTEGNTGTTPATFSVILSNPSTSQVTVDWATDDGTATSPADFAADSGTVTFAAGDDEEDVIVDVNGDVIYEGTEAFSVDLTNPSGGTLGDGEGVGTITDDDDPPTISVLDATVTEGNAGTTPATFAVTLSNPSAFQVTVAWDTADGIANAPSDYASAGDTVTFPVLDTSETVSVQVNGDTAVEPDETFFVDLTAPTGDATIGDAQGQGTIENDDASTCPGFASDPRPQIVGSAGTNDLIGTAAGEVLCGLGGNDRVRGGGGKDLVLGGAGNDRLAGQGGRDLLKGQAGRDRMNGGPGLDTCVGGPGKDVARACERGRA